MIGAFKLRTSVVFAVLAGLLGAGERALAGERDEISLPGIETLELVPDTPVDPELQRALEAADQRIREKLAVEPQSRAIGVVDLTRPRVAWLRPDAIFYGASVPKICILAAYFERFGGAEAKLSSEVERELGLVIKRSSNELAAKYSQLVGLEAIQALQTSPRYRFYDATTGGGLWSGKHYGIGEPRTVEPVGGHSHAATVRQCLRYYLFLERGDLVHPRAAAAMRRVFASPALEFHDDNFVRGLRGRGVSVLRKNGLWEDWHLDTARVRNGERVYLLAGMVRHPAGGEYLAQIASAIDDTLAGSPRPHRRFRHDLIIHSRDELAAGHWTVGEGAARAEYESPTITTPHPFSEVLPSWNIEAPTGSGFLVELRVKSGDTWSPYLAVGEWGRLERDTTQVTKWTGGSVEIDYYRANSPHRELQYRVTLLGTALTKSSPGRSGFPIHRIALALTNSTGIPLGGDDPPAPRPKRSTWTRRLSVPYRSQKTEDPKIAHRICSPTSVAMLLAYHGRNVPTARVAERIFDGRHDIYGNWPRAVQGAFSFGVPGYVARFGSWREVEQSIANDQPLVISIRTKDGELAGAPHAYPGGHLLVVTGFDGDENVHVNDPAAADAASGRTTYLRPELERAWLDRGGTAYVLLPPETDRSAARE